MLQNLSCGIQGCDKAGNKNRDNDQPAKLDDRLIVGLDQNKEPAHQRKVCEDHSPAHLTLSFVKRTFKTICLETPKCEDVMDAGIDGE